MMQRLPKFSASGLLRRAGDQRGFTIVEALVGASSTGYLGYRMAE